VLIIKFYRFTALALSLSLCACTSEAPSELQLKEPPIAEQSEETYGTPGVDISLPAAGEAVISFEYEKQSGWASNQFAVWIEDAEGNFIKTLYATRYTATGGYKDRPGSIREWVAKSELASMEKPEVDAITSATPKAGILFYTWDLTDKNGIPVLPGEYNYFVEGSLRWNNSVIYSGLITLGEVVSFSEAYVAYFFEESANQAALTEASPEVKMVHSVKAEFIPR
jgi:hypothetical protein